ncbi:hypothetical protein [Aquibacillus saliphilus]|uniref:hypothetical protein n=1 Tax=Aquibacillus saliphilus TaxID=1909422 RepID=UPI001CF09666|nr:hypothetical protein [Aquibacillus saliphilus]
MNLTTNIEMNDFNKTQTRGGYRSLAAKTVYDNGRELNYSTVVSTDIISFIEEALQDIVQKSVTNGEDPHDITVNLPVTLSAGIKTSLSDKYQADTKVNSITFA